METGEAFVEKMKKPVFVATLLSDAGINRPPCFCCLNHVQKTCSLVLGEPNCTDYILYSTSPTKVERRFLFYINTFRQLESKQHKHAV